MACFLLILPDWFIGAKPMTLFDVMIVALIIVAFLVALRYTKNNGCDQCDGCTKNCKKIDIYKAYKEDHEK